jgi:hypothetical protein
MLYVSHEPLPITALSSTVSAAVAALGSGTSSKTIFIHPGTRCLTPSSFPYRADKLVLQVLTKNRYTSTTVGLPKNETDSRNSR